MELTQQQAELRAAFKAADKAYGKNRTPENYAAFRAAGDAWIAARPRAWGNGSRAGRRQHAEMMAAVARR